jgi:hypothetical protein
MGRILQARMVNAALGGLAVGPGDIDGLQDEFLQACHAIVFTVPDKARLKQGKDG